jgi:glycerol kinase
MSTGRAYILAIDQGTSSTKSLLFDAEGKTVAKGVELLHTTHGSDGFVEQDPQEIFENVLKSVAKCVAAFTETGGNTADIVACGISNQRETFLLWDESGKPLCNAVVWQCKRSVQICERLKKNGLEEKIRASTGLIIDPYFSGTKLTWLYENISSVKNAIDNGKAYFGTIDTWLLYKFTNGESYATDYSNASRTLFFNLKTLNWDNDLLEEFGLKGMRLPEVKASSSFFGEAEFPGVLNKKIPITAMIGDSHAAAFGEGCFDSGTGKATLGTGCSILVNTGDQPVWSKNGMMTTICWSTEDQVAYAFEGIIVSCGSTIEWLKNELNLFAKSSDTSEMAVSVTDNGGVYIIPAFSGLGSPHWQMDGKATITGLTFGTTKNHIVRAALESIPYQIKDVVNAMEIDLGSPVTELMINGGMTSNEFIMQLIADLSGIRIKTDDMQDMSALGAAYLAGLKAGVYKSIDALKKLIQHNQTYVPGTDLISAKHGYEGWQHEIRNFSRRSQKKVR